MKAPIPIDKPRVGVQREPVPISRRRQVLKFRTPGQARTWARRKRLTITRAWARSVEVDLQLFQRLRGQQGCNVIAVEVVPRGSWRRGVDDSAVSSTRRR